jgi:tetratricopeptide (TPR) repeat protein
MRARLAIAAASCVALASVSSPAGAQQAQGGQPVATDTRALAETLFFTARGLMEAGRYPEACAKLSESYRLDPAAGTLLNLAVCNQKIGKIASAWGEFRDAQAEARRMSRSDREQLASDAIKVLEPELPFLAIEVPPQVRAVHGLEILRNGIPIQGAAWDTELPVDPGDVEVVERAPGYKPKTLHVSVANKQHAKLDAVPLELAPIERPPVPFWTGRRTAGALLLVAGVGAAAGGAAFGLAAENYKKNSDTNCPSYLGLRCTQAGIDDMSNARTAAWLSDVAFGLAAVGVGVGAYFFFTAGGQERSVAASASATAWQWTVSGGPRSAQGLLMHSF